MMCRWTLAGGRSLFFGQDGDYTARHGTRYVSLVPLVMRERMILSSAPQSKFTSFLFPWARHSSAAPFGQEL